MRNPEHAAQQPMLPALRQGVNFPRGLLGFAGVTNYTLVAHPEEHPFQWLEMVEDAARSFLVVAPEEVIGWYEPVITREDAAFLGIEDLREALVLAVVASPAGGQATMNLKSPIVINPRTWIGRQIILSNVSALTFYYPLAVCPARPVAIS
jgi:flagellar assembly factor FliW